MCKNGNLEYVKFFYNNFKSKIDVYKYSDYEDGAFQVSCINNHINVAKYIYYEVLKEDNDYLQPTII